MVDQTTYLVLCDFIKIEEQQRKGCKETIHRFKA